MTGLGWQNWIELAGKTIGTNGQSPLEYVEEHVDSLCRAWRLEEESDCIFHTVAMATYVTAVSEQKIRELYQESAVSMFTWREKNETKSYGVILLVEPYFREIQRIISPRKEIVEQGFASIDEVLTIISSRGKVSIESVTKSAERIIKLLNSPMGPILAADACFQVARYAKELDIDLPDIKQYESLDGKGLFYILSPALFATMKIKGKLGTTNQNISPQNVATVSAGSVAEKCTKVVKEDNTKCSLRSLTPSAGLRFASLTDVPLCRTYGCADRYECSHKLIMMFQFA